MFRATRCAAISPFQLFLQRGANKNVAGGGSRRGFELAAAYFNLPQAQRDQLIADAKAIPSQPFKRDPDHRLSDYQKFVRRKFHSVRGLPARRFKRIAALWRERSY